MTLILEVFGFVLLLIALVAGSLMITDAGRRRQRKLHADVQDGMPDEIDNLPSRADGSTEPE